jgi:hypothetical protein
MTKGTGKPTLAGAGRACQQEPVTLAYPVAACELEEERAVEASLGAEVDVLDLRVMTQPGGAGTSLKALLAPHRCFLLEQDGEPFAMIEGAGFRLGSEILEGFGHAVQAEVAHHVEGGMGQHDLFFPQWK